MGIRFETKDESYTGPRYFPNHKKVTGMQPYNDSVNPSTRSDVIGLIKEDHPRGRYLINTTHVTPTPNALVLSRQDGNNVTTITIENHTFEILGIEAQVIDEHGFPHWGVIFPTPEQKASKT